jgi:hypothetical protein
LIRIGGRLSAPQHSVIASTFGFERELPPCHPDERMKPVTGAYHSRNALAHPVAAPDVFQFVDDCSTEVILFPGLRVWWQHDGWSHQTATSRAGDTLVQQQVDATANSGVGR